MRAIVISLGTARQEQVRADVAQLLEQQASIDVIVTKSEPWERIASETRLHEVGVLESRHPVLRLERFVVLRVPRLRYQLGARLLSLLSRVLPGGLGRTATAMSGRWKARWLHTKERSDRFHKERFGAWYGRLRPFVLWRTVRRQILPGLNLDIQPPDLVIYADGLSTPTAWHLAQKYPSAGVGTDLDSAILDRERYGRSAGPARRS